MRIALPVLILPLSMGCGGKLLLGGGPEKDARLVSDVYTWLCSGTEDEDEDATQWQGVFGWKISLEYTPDALNPLSLPSEGGCSADLSMFPVDYIYSDFDGEDLTELTGDPTWTTDSSNGKLEEVTTGFWYDNVYDNVMTCQEIDEIMGSGTELTSAESFTSAISPQPGNVTTVEYEGDFENGIDWGTELELSWDETGWDKVWIQIRRERDGETYESVTCNATGSDSFTIDDAVYSLMDEELTIDINNLYVAFQSSEVQEMDDGQKIEMVSRAISVAVVRDN